MSAVYTLNLMVRVHALASILREANAQCSSIDTGISRDDACPSYAFNIHLTNEDALKIVGDFFALREQVVSPCHVSLLVDCFGTQKVAKANALRALNFLQPQDKLNVTDIDSGEQAFELAMSVNIDTLLRARQFILSRRANAVVAHPEMMPAKSPAPRMRARLAS